MVRITKYNQPKPAAINILTLLLPAGLNLPRSKETGSPKGVRVGYATSLRQSKLTSNAPVIVIVKA